MKTAAPHFLPAIGFVLLLATRAVFSQTSTNPPPVVMISDPTNAASFESPATIGLIAPAGSPSGYVTAVQYFANAQSIGISSNFAIVDPPGPGPYPYQRAFFFSWSNVSSGTYSLTAVATDNSGLAGTSAPVNIIVTNNPLLPVVTIFAPDPVASVGGNCPCAPAPPPASVTNSWPPWTNFADDASASFVIARSSPSNTPLTVFYSMEGTATNGVDYATLSGSATIPVGRRTVQIPIMPLDNGNAPLPPAFKTVVLQLQASPSSPPAYAVGFPAQAIAVIVQNDTCPQTSLMPDGIFHFGLPETNGFWFRIDSSTNLSDWLTICTNIVDHGALHFLDGPATPATSPRFYRVTPVSVPATWPE